MQRFDLKSFRIDRKLTQKELAELLMCKQNYKVLLINRVNPDRVLDAQREISNAITTAIITNEPTGELELLKSDIENLKSHISQ